MKAYHRVAMDLTRTEPHVWVPVGVQDLVTPNPYHESEEAAADRKAGRYRIVGDTTDRYIIHACGCGDWRLVPMDGDYSEHIERRPLR